MSAFDNGYFVDKHVYTNDIGIIFSDWTNKKTLKRLKNHLWCHMSDIFQTVSTDRIDIYQLRELAEVFNLSGDLLAI